MKAFVAAAEESEQLAHKYIYDWRILISRLGETRTFHGEIVFANYFGRNILANDNLRHSESLVLQFKDQVALEPT